MNFQEKFDKLRIKVSKSFESKGRLIILLKVILPSLIGMFAGAGFIGFISEYATYYFSYSYGARLPVESVPYLSVTITLVSLFILSSTAIVYLLLIFYFKLISFVIESAIRLLEKKSDFKISPSSIRLAIFFGFFTTLIEGFFEVISTMVRWFKNPLQEVLTPPKASINNISEHRLIILLIISVVMLSYYLHTKINKNNFFLVIIFTLVSGISLSLFNTDVYGNFLRKTKLGGGVKISLYINNNKIIKGSLFMITTNNFIIYQKAEGYYIEIPRKNVYKYMYKQNSDWYLPVQ